MYFSFTYHDNLLFNHLTKFADFKKFKIRSRYRNIREHLIHPNKQHRKFVPLSQEYVKGTFLDLGSRKEDCITQSLASTHSYFLAFIKIRHFKCTTHNNMIGLILRKKFYLNCERNLNYILSADLSLFYGFEKN